MLVKNEFFHRDVTLFRGGYANNKTNLTGFCDEGYTGNACATCETGWGKFGSNFLTFWEKLTLQGSEECLNCSSNSSYYIKLFFLLALQLTLIILNIL